MLPSSVVIDHPITGADITAFMLRFNLSMDDLSALLSVPKSKLPGMMRETEPVTNVAIALLVRIYSENPQLLPTFDIQEFYKAMDGSATQKLRQLSLDFGRDSSASYRWIHKGRPMSGQALSLGRLAEKLTDGRAVLRRNSVLEAKLRGVNPYKTGSWSKPASFDNEGVSETTYRKRTKASTPTAPKKSLVPISKKAKKTDKAEDKE